MSSCYKISIETDGETGETLSVYFQVRSGRSRQTREYADGSAFADFNSRGELIGIELLAPCRVSIVDKIAKDETTDFRRQTKNFIKQSGPRAMVPA